MDEDVDDNSASALPGPLTQDIRYLRAAASHALSPPHSPSQPPSTSTSFLVTQPDEAEASFLYRTAHDDAIPFANEEIVISNSRRGSRCHRRLAHLFGFHPFETD